jgi:hypothetical protein
MGPFFLSHEEFWAWFHLDKKTVATTDQQQKQQLQQPSNVKRVKTRHEQVADISTITHKRYICLYGKHRPGKKTKVWEGDGYLSITTNNMGHLCDLRGRLLEEPTVMDEVDFESGDEIQIGDMEVQIVDLDET